MAQKDRRYGITPEFTGHASGKKRFVLRFEGTRVSDHASRYEAEQEIAKYKKAGTIPNVNGSRVLVGA